MESVEQIKQILQPILEAHNTELIEISLGKARYKPVLQILVDKKGGITLEECSQINRQLSDILDKEDVIKESYILEVSSPGIDRPLKVKRDFEKAAGEVINVYTKAPVNGKGFFQAILYSVDEKFISLKTKDGDIIKISYENIHLANPEIKF